MAKMKYELGQRLWPVLTNRGESFVNPPFDAMCAWLEGNEVYYSFTHAYGFPECNVFATEADALVERDARNRW